MIYAIKHHHTTTMLDSVQLPGWTLENDDEIMDGWNIPGNALAPPSTAHTLYPSLLDVLENMHSEWGRRPVRVYSPVASYAENVPVGLHGFELAGLWLPMTGGRDG